MSLSKAVLQQIITKNKSTTNTLDQQILNNKARIENTDVPENLSKSIDTEVKTTPLQSVLNFFNKTTSAANTALGTLTENFQAGVAGATGTAKAIKHGIDNPLQYGLEQAKQISPNYANAVDTFKNSQAEEDVIGGIAKMWGDMGVIPSYIEGYKSGDKMGSDLVRDWDINDKRSEGFTNTAGFFVDVLNPMDPINYIDFAQVTDAVKVGSKGTALLSKAFGKYGDEIGDILGKYVSKTVATKTDDLVEAGTKGAAKALSKADPLAQIGGSTLGKMIKNIDDVAMKMPVDEVTKLKALMKKGLGDSGLKPSYRMASFNKRAIKIQLDSPFAPLREVLKGAGNLGVYSYKKMFKALGKQSIADAATYLGATRGPVQKYLSKVGVSSGLLGSGLSTMASGVYQGTRIGINWVTNSLIDIPGLGKVLTSGGDSFTQIGKALGKLFSTKAIPKEMPQTVILKNLVTKHTQEAYDMAGKYFQGDELEQILAKLPEINMKGQASLDVSKIAPSKTNEFLSSYTSPLKGDMINIKNISDATYMESDTIEMLLSKGDSFELSLEDLTQRIQAIESALDPKVAATKAILFRKVLDDVYGGIPDQLKGYFKGTMSVVDNNTKTLFSALENNMTDMSDSPLLSAVFRYKGVDIWVPLTNINKTVESKWLRTLQLMNGIDSLPPGMLASLQEHVVQSPVFLKGASLPGTTPGAVAGSMDPSGVIVISDPNVQTIQHEFAHAWDKAKGVTMGMDDTFETASKIDAVVDDLSKRTPEQLIADKDGNIKRKTVRADRDMAEDFAIGTQRSLNDPTDIMEEAPARSAVILGEIRKMEDSKFLAAIADDSIIQAQRARAHAVRQPIKDQINNILEHMDSGLADGVNYTFQEGETAWRQLRGKIQDLMEKEAVNRADVMAMVEDVFKGVSKEERSVITDIMSDYSNAEITQMLHPDTNITPKVRTSKNVDTIIKERGVFAAKYDALSDGTKDKIERYMKLKESMAKSVDNLQLTPEVLQGIRDDYPVALSNLRKELLEAVPERDRKSLLTMMDNYSDSEIQRYIVPSYSREVAYDYPQTEFVSVVKQVVNNSMPEKMNADDVLKWLTNQPGVKADEIVFRDLEEAIDLLKNDSGLILKEDLTKFLDNPEYKVNLHVIDSEMAGLNDFDQRPIDFNTTSHGKYSRTMGDENYTEFKINYNKPGPPDNAKSIANGHYTQSTVEENVVGTVRGFEDVINDKKTFVIEELQSDWFQHSRKIKKMNLNPEALRQGIPQVNKLASEYSQSLDLNKIGGAMDGQRVTTDTAESIINERLLYQVNEDIREILVSDPYAAITHTGNDDILGLHYTQRNMGEIYSSIHHQWSQLSKEYSFSPEQLNLANIKLRKTVEQSINNSYTDLIDKIAKEVEFSEVGVFSKTWQEASLKRVVAWARDNGFEQVATVGSDVPAKLWGHVEKYQVQYDDIMPRKMKKITKSPAIENLVDGESRYLSSTEMENMNLFALDNMPDNFPMFREVNYEFEQTKFVDMAVKLVDEKMPNKMATSDVVPWLMKQPGVKIDEVVAFGLDDYLKQNPGKITKDEVLNILKDPGNAVEWYEVQTPQYRDYSVASDMDDYKEFQMVTKESSSNDIMSSKHFTTTSTEGKNQISHVRGYGTDMDGKRTFIVEEVQSDGHQAGRTHGYLEDKGEDIKADFGRFKTAIKSGADDYTHMFIAEKSNISPYHFKKIKDSYRELAESPTYSIDQFKRKIANQIDAMGMDVDFVEVAEGIGSPWAHTLEKGQYITANQWSELRPMVDTFMEKVDLSLFQAKFGDGYSLTHKAAFSKNWEEASLRRVTAWAIDNGYEQVGIVNSDVPAKWWGNKHKYTTSYDTVLPSKMKKITKSNGIDSVLETDGIKISDIRYNYMAEEFDDAIDMAGSQYISDLEKEIDLANMYGGIDGYKSDFMTERQFNNFKVKLEKVLNPEYIEKNLDNIMEDIMDYIDSVDYTELYDLDNTLDTYLSMKVQWNNTVNYRYSVNQMEEIIEILRRQVGNAELDKIQTLFTERLTSFPGYSKISKSNVKLFPLDNTPKEMPLFRHVASNAEKAEDFKYMYGKLSPEGRSAVEGFAGWRQGIVNDYSAAGIPINKMEKYFPFIPQSKLTDDEASVLKGVYSNVPDSKDGDVLSNFFDEIDPNRKPRTIKYNNPKQVNKLVKKGWLTEDAAQAMAVRGSRAATALEVKGFLDEFMGEYGLNADDLLDPLFKGTIPSNYQLYSQKVLDNGQVILEPVTRIGKEGMDNAIALPTGMVDTLNTYMDTMFNTTSRSAIVRLLDKMTSVYKKLAYLWNPGHIPRDFTGNVFNGYLMGLREPTPYIQAGNILMNPDGSTLDVLVNGVKETWTGTKVLEYGHKHGVLDVGFYVADTPRSAEEALSGIGKGVNKLKGGYSKVMRKGTQISDTYTRLAGFVDNLNKGLSITDSAARVKKFYFDYYDLTPFERKYMKRIIPFYTWMRKNIPLQVEQLLTQPRIYKNIQNFRSEIQGYPADGSDTPEYINDSMAFKVGDKYLAPNMPYGDLSRVPFDWDSFRQLAGSVNPFMRVPIELGLNANFFQGNAIEDYQGELGNLPFTELLSKMGVDISDIGIKERGLGYILQQIPMLNNLDILTDENNSRRPSRTSTMLGGPAIYDEDKVEKASQYDKIDLLQAIIQLLKDQGVDVPSVSDIPKESANKFMKYVN